MIGNTRSEARIFFFHPQEEFVFREKHLHEEPHVPQEQSDSVETQGLRSHWHCRVFPQQCRRWSSWRRISVR